GNFDAAQTAYRKTTALDSKNVKAWSSLLQITRQTDTGNDISALKALFETLGTADDRLHIGHALAKAYEDLGQPAPAMAWLAKAKETKKSEIDYQPRQDKALFAAAARTVTATAQEGHHDRAPIFIIGLPRTGTTLVDRILSSHSEIQSAGELTDFALALKRATGTPSRYVLDAETLDAAASADLVDVGREYISMARRVVPNTVHFIDKMPLNFFSAAIIHKALPDARIICLRRHPADSVLSNYRQLFATGFSYYNYAFDLADTAAYYARFDTLISQYKEALPANRFTEVAYEDIVDDLEKQARRLIGFCGLDWEPACLSFHQNKAPVATASSSQVRQPLYSSSVGRWKRYRAHLQPALDVLAAHGLQSG
ncbi:MAG: sulfotransferase, partial [Henriciella sp.]|nr:sulfotransferase [Henriciella sp.]